MSETHSQTSTALESALGHMDALPMGTRLGEFELQGLLGVGGFGMVYKAYDHSLQRAVAIKEYMPAALVGRVAGLQVSVRSTLDDQPFRAGLTSFISEARLLARFDHPSLVKVYRFWEANNTAYMVMPLYQGMTLKAARSLMSGPPSEEWLRTILWSVTQALKVLHDNGTIHRDVSPDNIFLQDIGAPVLLDLGAARRAVLERGHKHTAILKVNYAPIEQYADATDLQEGPWTDLYALGAVMHGCVCNEAPLPATSRVVRDSMPPFSRVAQTAQTHFGTHYSPAFVDAIAHTLAIEPAGRTQSVLDFCEEMQLQVSVEWSRFDWRLALGDSVSLVQPATATATLQKPSEVHVSEQTKTQSNYSGHF
jgi:serine/threonine protein kinase